MAYVRFDSALRKSGDRLCSNPNFKDSRYRWWEKKPSFVDPIAHILDAA